MRLRELKYPIALFGREFIHSGKYAGLEGPRRWNNNSAQYYIDGKFDQVMIMDSLGRKYTIEKIFLNPMPLWRQITSKVTTVGSMHDSVDIDMELALIGNFEFEKFKGYVLKKLLENPSWWKHNTADEELLGMFEGCTSFSQAIDEIGVFEGVKKNYKKQKSTKIVDLR